MGFLSLVVAAAACGGAAAATGPDDGGVNAAAEKDTIVVVAGSSRIPVDGVVQLEAKVRDEEGRVVRDAAITWSSSDPAVASVNANGRVKGHSNGLASIFASSGGRRGKVEVDVYRYLSAGETGELIPAFPGADGWGATALLECRNRPLQILRVTNTNASGSGSLAEAVLQARGERFTFIVFETGGRIKTPPDEGIRLNSSCVYIAGQTAPGDGVVLQGQSTAFWIRGSGSNVSNIVMRYLRFRGEAGVTRNNIIIAKGERIMLDHLSFSWTDNYILALLRYGGQSFSAPISDVSVQNSIASEVFAVHPTGPVIGTNGDLKEAPEILMTNVSMHRNLWAHNSHRNPMTAADNTLIANNVIYNWSIGAGMMNRRGMADWVNNYGKAGPMTRDDNSYLVNPYCDELGGDFSIFAAGNVGPMSADPTGDNWTGPTRQVACYHNTGDEKGQEVPEEWRRHTEQDWRSAEFPVNLRPAKDAYELVLGDVGANKRLTCDGKWVDALDSVDRRVIEETRKASGVSEPPESEIPLGGYPSYAKGAACDDEDWDGLPDAWEQRYYNCDTCADPAELGRDGYLLMEHYVNGTSPR